MAKKNKPEEKHTVVSSHPTEDPRIAEMLAKEEGNRKAVNDPRTKQKTKAQMSKQEYSDMKKNFDALSKKLLKDK